MVKKNIHLVQKEGNENTRESERDFPKQMNLSFQFSPLHKVRRNDFPFY